MEQKKNYHLLRRVLVPLLIVALPIAAMVAYILYHKQARLTSNQDPLSVAEPVSFGNESWPIFRGDAALTGRATGSLPRSLELAWKFETGDAVRSAPVIADNTVFASSMDSYLYAVDLKTGTEIWKFSADDELEASPLYQDGFVYVGSNSGTFYCIDAQTGQKQWSVEINGKITGSANSVTDPDSGQSVILVGCYDNNLYCLDAETGEQIFVFPAESYINGSIAVAENTVFFGSCDANIYLVPIDDPNSGTTIDAGSYVAANPTIDDGTLFAGSFEGTFLAADIQTQHIIWQFDEGEDAFFSSPAVNDTIVVVGCRDEHVYCFDRISGEKRWTFSAEESFDSSPVICGHTVAIGCEDGRLYLLDSADGTEIFSYTLGSPIVSSAAIAQNHLIIGCDNGSVYAFVEKPHYLNKGSENGADIQH